MSDFIPLSVPNFAGNELKYVTEAVKTEWVSTGGAFINKFEDDIAEYLKVNGAVACQSGTAAIHLSLLECGVGIYDEVIVPTLTFIAAVNPVNYCNAHPVFMDCDDSLTMDMNKLEEFCLNECDYNNGQLINKKSKRKIKAVVVVHVFGNMADMEKLMDIAEKYNLKVIEDATEALGSYYTHGKYKGKFAGTIGDFGCFSFNGNKIITTGGGGMVVAKNDNNLQHIKYLSTQAKDDTLNYVHNEVGYNYRMTNIQAALGVAQLENLEEFIKIKKENYYLYESDITNVKGINLLKFREGIRPNFWFYSLILDNHLKRDKFIDLMKNVNIQTRPIWGLIHEQKPYINYQNYKIEKAEYYNHCIVNIPCSTNLNKNQVQDVINKMKEFLNME